MTTTDLLHSVDSIPAGRAGFRSPTYSFGDVEGYSWISTNMPPSLCEWVGVTSRTASDALARLAAGAWQANHRHLYVAARSEMQRRGLLEAYKF